MHQGTWRRGAAFFLPGWNKFNNPPVDPCRPRTMLECAASASCARASSAYSRDGELGLGLHGPKDGNPKASPPHECRCVQLANGARLETPDGSTILNGSQGGGKTSCPAKTTVTLHVNRVERQTTIAPWTPTLHALR